MRIIWLKTMSFVQNVEVKNLIKRFLARLRADSQEKKAICF